MKADCNGHVAEIYRILESLVRVSKELAVDAERGDIDNIENRLKEHERLMIMVRERLELLNLSNHQDRVALKDDPKYLQFIGTIRKNMTTFIKIMDIRKDESYQNIQKLQKQKSIIEYIAR